MVTCMAEREVRRMATCMAKREVRRMAMVFAHADRWLIGTTKRAATAIDQCCIRARVPVRSTKP